jgi:hypothetical protein
VNYYGLRLISIAGKAYREIPGGPDGQGVWHVPPSDDRASALAGSDWISNTVVVGFGFNEPKPGIEPQAANPKPHIIKAKARFSFMCTFRRSRLPPSSRLRINSRLPLFELRTASGFAVAKPAMNFRRGIRHHGLNLANCQSCIEIFDQVLLLEGLAKDANRPCR